MKTYILAETQTTQVVSIGSISATNKLVSRLGFFSISREDTTSHLALFISAVDAEIVRIKEKSKGKRFEVLETSRPHVQEQLKKLLSPTAVVAGFMVNAKQELINTQEEMSLLWCPAFPDDTAWLVGGGTEPITSIRHALETIYVQKGRAGHLAEICATNLTKQQWERLADVALSTKTIKDGYATDLFEVFSVTRKSWR